MKLKMMLLAGFMCMGLAGCGADGLDGTYTGAGGSQEFRFSPDGTFIQSVMGKKVADHKYEKDGNKIKVEYNGNTQVWTLHENGDIHIPTPGGDLIFTVKK